MNRRRWLVFALGIALFLCAGWHIVLFRVPTDNLISDGNFSDGQFHLRYYAPPGSPWSEDGVNLYRAVLRVDTRGVDAWLSAASHSVVNPSWEVGSRHQYLVDRRDGDGKRVINITLQLPGTNQIPGHLVLVALVTFGVSITIALKQPAEARTIPIVCFGAGTLIGLGWWTVGTPFSFLASGWPFWGQIVIHIGANSLVFGAMLHLAMVYNPLIRRSRLLILVAYGLYPVGVLLISIAQSNLTNVVYWEYQAAILLKAVSYLVWTRQYRRANVSQRGQMHWLLAGIIGYDLIYVVQVISGSEPLLPVVQWMAVLPPLGYMMALLPGPRLRIALEPTYSVVQGIANTLTLALFLSGLGLAATVLTENGQQQTLPLVMIGLAILLSLATVPLTILIREQFDNWFGGTRGAQRALLHEFTQQISHQIALDGVLRAFREALNQGVQCTTMGLWLWNDESKTLEAVDVPTGAPARVMLDDSRQGALLDLQNFSTSYQLWPGTMFYGLISLTAQGKLVGVCAISPRVDGSSYSTDTLNFFETLTRAATLAFRNAQLVQQLEDSLLALRNAYQQLVTAQEQERKHLAAELHDATLQQLAHINLVVGQLPTKTNGDQRLAINELQRHIIGTERGLREILRGLHPAALVDLGLVPALQSWLPRPAGVIISLTTVGFDDRRLPDQSMELALYRLAQESVNNALKHAQAQHIDLKLCWQGNTITLQVIDDGIGFEPVLNGRGNHFGLINLHERVRALNGTLTIQSQPQHGTTISITLTIAQNQGE